LEIVEQGLATAKHNSEQIFEAELYRLKASAVLARGGPDAENHALPLLRQALRTAQDQRALSLELRAAMDLAALCLKQNKRAEALNLLAPIHNAFVEGFDTHDVREGRALLDRCR
jgi:predicted ATPase